MQHWRWQGSVLIVAALAASPATAGGYATVRVWPSCYSVPVYASWTIAYPVTYLYYVTPVLVTPSVPLAVPTAAPPSRLEMPPAGKALKMSPPTGPTVIEARSHTSDAATAATDRCRVGFWNLTGKDLTLVVGGQTRVLSRDRAITLELPREFVWRVDEQGARNERVSADKASYEVVIR